MAFMKWLALGGAFVAGIAATFADVTSGPKVGDKIEPLKVFAATGEFKDKEVDYSAARKDKPTVYVFINEWNRPVARFLKELDTSCKKDSEEVYLVAVWLTDDADKTKEYLPRAQASLKLENTALTLFADKNGPNGWGINSTAHVTVVVASKAKTADSFAFVSINETDVPRVLEAIKKAAK